MVSEDELIAIVSNLYPDKEEKQSFFTGMFAMFLFLFILFLEKNLETSEYISSLYGFLITIITFFMNNFEKIRKNELNYIEAKECFLSIFIPIIFIIYSISKKKTKKIYLISGFFLFF